MRDSEFHVNMRYSLQPAQKKLTLYVQWNSIFFKQSVQDVLAPRFTGCITKKTLFTDQIDITEK